ncbi:MAG: peptidoglycan-binding domain-containing protein [Campylobacterota bacterium]|nr:peptidoglycan-binding domain-containing protein [Campylobacterota bacterium]
MKIRLSLIVISMLAASSFIAAEELSPIPPSAKAGECYAKVVVPAKYEDKSEQILVKVGAEKIEVIPPEYEFVEKNITVEAEGKELVVVPAKFKKVTEKIMLEPAKKLWKTSLEKDAPFVDSRMLTSIEGFDLNTTTPGTCYKKYYKAAEYKTVEENITVQEATEKIEIIPAEYKWAEKEVLVTPESKKVVEVAAVYDTKEEKILVEPEKTVWKKGSKPTEDVEGATGEIMCLVKIPAKYKIIKKKVLVSPASTQETVVPAEYETVKVRELIKEAEAKKIQVPAAVKTISKVKLVIQPEFKWFLGGDNIEEGWQYAAESVCLVEVPAKYIEIEKNILEEAATTKEVVVPVKYKTVKVGKLVAEGKTVTTPIPEEYKTISKSSKVADAKVTWQRILCQTNMNDKVITEIQNALNEKGYSVGQADGRIGNATYRAIKRYQIDNSLATGGITYETLISLGIKK